MTETILFSTITVSYNSEKTISRTIESLLKQSIKNIEYIIIDGNSTDKTVEVYYFEVAAPQQSPQQVEFQTLQNSFTLENSDSVVLLAWGQNPFANNGAGALQLGQGAGTRP